MKAQIFSGVRLKKARLFNEMTLSDLAKEISAIPHSITKQSLSLYENGSVAPKYETILAFVKVLQFPYDYFFENDSFTSSSESTYFRSLQSTSKRIRLAYREQADFTLDIFSVLNKYVNFPPLRLTQLPFDVPDLSDEEISESEITNQEIEKVADQLRLYWKIPNGPIKSMQYLVENNGILVSQISDTEKGVDAFSQQKTIDGSIRPLITLAVGKKPACRIRFDIGHELGHIILHPWSENLEELSPANFRERENQAQRFAGALLLPRNEFVKDVMVAPLDLDYYIILKQKWNVSIQAMLYRARQLNIIDPEFYQKLMIKLSRKGWRKEEPLDHAPYILPNTIMSRAIQLMLSNSYSAEDILSAMKVNGLSLYPEMIERLCSLPHRTLTPKTSFPPLSIK
ncbi:helix-turn-helix domain-containing protein [Dialister hominis]|jgi:Zn-dependent peptidase ImmA (M78 family)/transcriptional regulator with XRE-family HTH domain|uniref:HTH cro/C1-type domain-containing protein n=1 Tax=Dialister hominis TaxID=2582419 RepID=A0A8D5A686_9FIRM|nr:XRE family transcriptional regulator [Dialister hominis]BBK25616.1 hypothetical protein Dia5BBH33_15510 [Dialister hominis]